jgi:hypothetical protein
MPISTVSQKGLDAPLTLTAPVISTITNTGTLTLPTTTGTLALTSQVIGVGQTWQNVFSSRAVGTTYTNSTGKPIGVAISYTCSQASTVQGLTINGQSIYCAGSEIGNGSGFFLIVPDGNTYSFLTNSGTISIVTWNELR